MPPALATKSETLARDLSGRIAPERPQPRIHIMACARRSPYLSHAAVKVVDIEPVIQGASASSADYVELAHMLVNRPLALPAFGQDQQIAGTDVARV